MTKTSAAKRKTPIDVHRLFTNRERRKASANLSICYFARQINRRTDEAMDAELRTRANKKKVGMISYLLYSEKQVMKRCLTISSFHLCGLSRHYCAFSFPRCLEHAHRNPPLAYLTHTLCGKPARNKWIMKTHPASSENTICDPDNGNKLQAEKK